MHSAKRNKQRMRIMENYGEMLDDTTIRFERMLPGPIERVWEYITESDKRAKWLCAGDTRRVRQHR